MFTRAAIQLARYQYPFDGAAPKDARVLLFRPWFMRPRYVMHCFGCGVHLVWVDTHHDVDPVALVGHAAHVHQCAIPEARARWADLIEPRPADRPTE